MYSTVDACKSDTCWAAAASTESLRQLRRVKIAIQRQDATHVYENNWVSIDHVYEI